MKVMLAGHILGQGGIQSHLRWLAKALVEEQVETMIVSLGNHQASGNSLQNIQVLIEQGITVKICSFDSSKSLGFNWRKIKRFLEMKTLIEEFNPDIYFAVGIGWNLFLPPLLSNGSRKCIFHEVMSGIPNGWKDSRWCVRGWFNEVVGQSQTVANTFAKCFGWRKSISALPAIPEPLELTASLPRVSQKTIPLGTAKAALFSRLAPHKQAFWLVQQWDLLKDYLAELHIHGTGSEEKLIREYIEAQGISDRVKCFGRYPEGQAYVDLLSSYDLTLLPTIGQEGAPLVLLESMACGVPFVAYGVGGIADYGVDNLNVLIISPQERNFIDGVLEMTKMLAIGAICQPQLQQYYLNHYSYKVLKQAWLLYLNQSS
jgi:glycosyltransferase involved in cell wall biosynthesis